MDFSTSPLALDAYARYNLDLFDDRNLIGVPTLFQSIFGRAATGSKTGFAYSSAVFDIDIIRGNERLAALIPRGVNVRVTDKPDTIQERFRTISRVFPLIEEESEIDSNQLLARRPGEAPLSQDTGINRMRGLGSSAHQEHIRRIVRLFEYLASQSALTGTMPALMGTTDADLLYDFLRPASHIIAISVPWDNAASTPLQDLDTACNLIRTDGHVKADYAIMGSQVITAFIKHATVQAYADNRRFGLIDIGSAPVPPNLAWIVAGGGIYRGRVQTEQGNELAVFTYLDTYTDSSGDACNYMPTDQVLIGSSQARCDRYFGPPEQLPNIPMRDQLYQQFFGFAPGMPPVPPGIRNQSAVVDPGMFYFDAYVDNNWKRITCRTQSAPIYATTQTDAFVTFSSGVVTV